ncbi:MAG: Mrp/NBP35 family ATP-binding protein [Bacteroidales bacterium]|nr:Mrp/NBP35 family ATP-binding protein [Bacteroidales bacterium]MDZ4205467.1 Mrp/NBP35 family ATP-binding protein [Bacteroidales bacterium]
MNYTKEAVLNALRHVNDPDLRKDLVTLNMIEDIRIDGTSISFKLVLTTPACPLKHQMQKECIAAIHKYIDPLAEVEVELSSRVTSPRVQTGDFLKGVKNIIAVASGKGGVGKSTVAVNLAVALGKTGSKVGLVDADIYGPSIPLMLGLMNARVGAIEIDGKTKVIPIRKHGISILSIGFFIESEKALLWRGPMASNALTQLFTEAEWGELDYMVIDMPPGTGDIHLTLVQKLPVSGAVIVTTPQEIALADARKAIAMFRQNRVNVPILGFVENMSYFIPAELPENRYYVFGKDGGTRLAAEYNVPLLGSIPLVQGICEAGDNGNPAVLNENSLTGKALIEMADNVARQVAIRNATLPPTQPVKMNTWLPA